MRGATWLVVSTLAGTLVACGPGDEAPEDAHVRADAGARLDVGVEGDAAVTTMDGALGDDAGVEGDAAVDAALARDGGAGGEDASHASTTLEDLGRTIAPAECEFMRRCVGAPLLEMMFPDGSCATQLASSFDEVVVGEARRAIGRDAVRYDPSALDACLTALREADCASVGDWTSACSSLFVGSVALGGACGWDAECETGVCWLEDACPGRCVARGAEGSPCAGSSCMAGLTCSAGTCVRLGALDEPCGVGGCLPGLACVGGATTGRCRPVAELVSRREGELCAPPWAYCEEGLSCVARGASMTCERPAASGAPCAIGYPDPCPAGEFCNGAVCTTYRAEGAPCASAVECRPGARCVPGDGTPSSCEPAGRDGDPCSADHDCLSERCLERRCALPGC